MLETVSLNMPALLACHKGHPARLAPKVVGPWKEQSRRSNLNLTEAVAHFRRESTADIVREHRVPSNEQSGEQLVQTMRARALSEQAQPAFRADGGRFRISDILGNDTSQASEVEVS